MREKLQLSGRHVYRCVRPCIERKIEEKCNARMKYAKQRHRSES